MTAETGPGPGGPESGPPGPGAEPDDATVVHRRPEPVESAGSAESAERSESAEDTVVARAPRPASAPGGDAGNGDAGRGGVESGGAETGDAETGAAGAFDETVAARAGEAFDETVVAVPGDSTPGPARLPEPSRGATGNPAPPVPEPERAGLPPALAARMFKSPLDTRYRVPTAPTGAPEHALPRRGVSPGLPVVTATRTGLRPAAADAPLEERLGRVPDSAPPPPAAPRDGLRSVGRADRRFGAVVLAGFATALVCSVLGLWGVAVLAFG